MGFLMYVKHMGWGKITQPKVLKNNAKKLKLTPKQENIRSFPNHKNILLRSLFVVMIYNNSDIIYERLLPF